MRTSKNANRARVRAAHQVFLRVRPVRHPSMYLVQGIRKVMADGEWRTRMEIGVQVQRQTGIGYAPNEVKLALDYISEEIETRERPELVATTEYRLRPGKD